MNTNLSLGSSPTSLDLQTTTAVRCPRNYGTFSASADSADHAKLLGEESLRTFEAQTQGSATSGCWQAVCRFWQKVMSYLFNIYGPKMTESDINHATSDVFSEAQGWERRGQYGITKYITKIFTQDSSEACGNPPSDGAQASASSALQKQRVVITDVASDTTNPERKKEFYNAYQRSRAKLTHDINDITQIVSGASATGFLGAAHGEDDDEVYSADVIRESNVVGCADVTASDMAMSDACVAHTAAADMVTEILWAYPREKMTIMIPLHQTGEYLLGLCKRNNYTTAVVEVNENGKITSICLQDCSNGGVDICYEGAKRLKAQFEQRFGYINEIYVNYRGDQSSANHNDSGRYSEFYISDAVDKVAQKSRFPTAEEFFEQYHKELKLYPWRYKSC